MLRTFVALHIFVTQIVATYAAPGPAASISSRTLPAALVRARNQLPLFVNPRPSGSSDSAGISDTCKNSFSVILEVVHACFAQVTALLRKHASFPKVLHV